MTRMMLAAIRLPLFVVLGGALLWMVSVAATPATIAFANALVAFLTVIVLPLALKYVKLDGAAMAALTYAASFVIAFGAALLSGELSLSALNGGSFTAILTFSSALFGVQQVVFQMIKDHPVAGKLVT
jgi:hypothetical protein